jgi:hypothetical protein
MRPGVWIRERRGQLTIEFLILMGLFILVLVGTTFLFLLETTADAREVDIVSAARFAAEEISSATYSASAPRSKRVLDVYLPGYRSAGVASGGERLANISTILTTDGENLITEVRITRYYQNGSLKLQEEWNFSRRLYGSGWTLYSEGVSGGVQEEIGSRYRVYIRPGNLSFVRGG